MNSLFELTAYTISDLPERCRQHYPQYNIRIERTAFYHTLTEAEEGIKRILADTAEYLSTADFHSFMVREIPFSNNDYCGRNALSWQLYDISGKRIMQSLCPDYYCPVPDEQKIFRGRDEDTYPFRVGDIVEVANYHRQEVRLAVVIGTPPTPKWCEQHINNDEGGWFHLDDSDDCFTVLDGPGPEWHSHEPAYALSAPRYPIPQYMQRKLMRNFEVYKKKCEIFLKK